MKKLLVTVLVSGSLFLSAEKAQTPSPVTIADNELVINQSGVLLDFKRDKNCPSMEIWQQLTELFNKLDKDVQSCPDDSCQLVAEAMREVAKILDDKQCDGISIDYDIPGLNL